MSNFHYRISYMEVALWLLLRLSPTGYDAIMVTDISSRISCILWLHTKILVTFMDTSSSINIVLWLHILILVSL